MKEIGKIKDYIISEFWFKYYVFWVDDNGQEWECGWFNELREALEYIGTFVK